MKKKLHQSMRFLALLMIVILGLSLAVVQSANATGITEETVIEESISESPTEEETSAVESTSSGEVSAEPQITESTPEEGVVEEESTPDPQEETSMLPEESASEESIEESADAMSLQQKPVLTPWKKLVHTVAEAPANQAVEVHVAEDLAATEEDHDSIVVKAGQNIILTGSGKVTGIKQNSIVVETGGSLTIQGPVFKDTQFCIKGNLVLKEGGINDSAFDYPLVDVEGGVFRVEGGEISGNTAQNLTSEVNSVIMIRGGSFIVSGGSIAKNQNSYNGGAVRMEGTADVPAILEISGGEFIGNKAVNPKKNASGGAIYGKYVKAAISGGTFSENSTEWGGAIALINSSVDISGGTFQGNTNGDYNGVGGALLIESGELHISAGNFTGNQANGSGGAIYAENTNCEISGGSFENNTAQKSGGAIAFLGSCNSTIYAGHFLSNTAEGFWGGGAIYNDGRANLQLFDTLVRNNQIKTGFLIQAGNHPVSAQGGGIWNCPTGHTTMHINRGLALFDNVAPDVFNGQNKGSGDDFANIRPHIYDKDTLKDPANHPAVSISARMLGGSPRAWYQDGSYYGIHENLDHGDQAPRFDAKNPGEPVPYDTVIADQAVFKSVPTEEAKNLAAKLAHVFFEGNVATGTGISGGAITNNGELSFGEPGVYTLRIEKKWFGDKEETRPTAITLEMFVGDYHVQDVELSAANDWSVELTDFPDPQSLKDANTGELLPITFQEKESVNYILAVEEESQDANNRIYKVILSNTAKTSVSVEKQWEDENDVHNKRPEMITVRLYADGQEINSAQLTAENDWAYTFKDLPKFVKGKEIQYTIREDTVEGYRSEIMEKELAPATDEETVEDAVKAYTIVNTFIPPEVPPETPPTPPEKPPVPPVPHTGDAGFASLLLCTAAAGVGLLCIRKKKYVK
uniref:Cna B-type domain-containing protein n=1 Tax=Ndongobacter massiliensis TaxID=1871025 RepID=UPI0009316C90|nr:Cna B-type domain-containing protein [Ndongobacter massiliensis]